MIVVTGAAGFIGSVLVWKFNKLGKRDLLLVDQKAQHTPKWNNIKHKLFSDYFESDKFIQKLEKGSFDGKISAIFHLGACSDTTEMNKTYLKENNTEYSKRIALWCVKNNVYLQYASSAATYGDGKLGFSDQDKLTPKLKPLNPYGQSKLDFDCWTIETGLNKKITGFRYFNVYGPNEYHKGNMRSMVQKGFEQMMSEGKLKLFKSYKKEYPDGGQKRDFIYVKDAVDAMIWFYERPKIKGIYNLGTGHAQSWNELAHALFKACHKKENIKYIEMPQALKKQYQYFTEADLGKLRRAGYKNEFQNVEKGVLDYVKNYLLKIDPYL